MKRSYPFLPNFLVIFLLSFTTGTVVAQMSGSYTIDQNGAAAGNNFTSFQAAATALNTQGISGSVFINVVSGSGPYMEQVTFSTIPGVDSNKNVFLNGNSETITFAPPDTPNYHIVRLNNVQYFTLNNLNIVGTHPRNGWGIHLLNNSNNVTISNCTIDLTTVTTHGISWSVGITATSSFSSVLGEGSNANNLLVTGNTIIGGSAGIRLFGQTGVSGAFNNRIVGNVITNIHEVGIAPRYQNGLVVSNNDINRINKTSVGFNFDGIYVFNDSYNMLVENNRIHDTHTADQLGTGNAYGIRFQNCDAPAGSENRIINNLIYNINTTSGTNTGIYNYSSDGLHIYHNTIVLDFQGATGTNLTRGFHQYLTATNVVFRNNIIVLTRFGTADKYALYFESTASDITSNNNLIWMDLSNTGSFVGRRGSSNYKTLNDWRSGTSHDLNSHFLDPILVDPSTGNLLPTNPDADNLGVNVGVDEDFLSNTRSQITPDIGAYEFTGQLLANDVGVTAFVSPIDSACASASLLLMVEVTNHGTDPQSNIPVEAQVTGAVTATLNGVLAGPLAPGATGNVTLGNINLPNSGVIVIQAYTQLATDGYHPNDSLLTLRTIVDPPTVSLNNDTTICPGESVVLTPSASADVNEFIWSTAEISSSIVVSPMASVTYTVTVSTPQGCTATADANITVHSVPNVEITTIDTVFCHDQSFYQLTAIPAGGTFSGPGISNDTFYTSDALAILTQAEFTYYYTITDTNGCTTTDSVEARVEVCESIFEKSVKAQALFVYPNPFTSELQITLPAATSGKVNLSLLEITGKTIQKATSEVRSGEQVINFQVSIMPAGIYLLKAEINGQLFYAKVVKQE